MYWASHLVCMVCLFCNKCRTDYQTKWTLCSVHIFLCNTIAGWSNLTVHSVHSNIIALLGAFHQGKSLVLGAFFVILCGGSFEALIYRSRWRHCSSCTSDKQRRETRHHSIIFCGPVILHSLNIWLLCDLHPPISTKCQLHKVIGIFRQGKCRF